MDSSALSFLLSQSLLAEQEAKEADELEADLAAREQKLLEEVERLRTSPTRGARGSPVEAAAAWWSLAKLASKKEESKRKRKKKRRKRRLPRSPRPLLVSGCCLRSTRARPRLLRTAWCYRGYKFLPRSRRLFGTYSTLFLREGGFCAVRTWKPGLSTHPRYLARTCLVPVAPEEHRKIGISGRSLAYFYDPSYLPVTCSVFARGVQDYGLFWEKTSRYAGFSASWFNSGYMSTSVYVVVFLAGCDAPRAVFPCLSAFRRRQQWQYTAGFTGDEAPGTVFSFPVVRRKMRDIMAGMDEKDSQAVHPCRGAEADSHGLLCSEDHRIPLLLLNKLLCVWQSLCACSVFACRVQDYGLFCEILQEWFPHSTLLGSTVDTSSASVHEACWKKFHTFYV